MVQACWHGNVESEFHTFKNNVQWDAADKLLWSEFQPLHGTPATSRMQDTIDVTWRGAWPHGRKPNA